MSPGYLTDLPPRRLPGAKLHEAIRMVREEIAGREGVLVVGEGVVREVRGIENGNLVK